jgi:hypothetical protein
MEASSSTPTQLRPLGLGEILDAAFKIYRTHFKTLALCVLVVAVPLTILAVLVQASAADNAFDPTPTAAQTDARFSGAGIAGFAGSALLAALATLLATAACTRAIAGAYLGEQVSWRESIRYAGRKLVPLIVLAILVALASALGVIVLFVGAIFVFVRTVVSTPVLLVEDVGPGAAFKRSWSLVGGRWWATFATVLIVYIITAVVGGILQVALIVPLLGGSGSELLGAVLTGLAQVLTNVVTLPLTAGVITLIYFDLRVRKEGFDLELLAHRVGAPAPASVAGLGGGDPPPSYGGFSPPTSDLPPR